MNIVIILSIVCTLLGVLLIIAGVIIVSYRHELKIYNDLSENIAKNLRITTNAIRDMCENAPEQKITINIESMVKELNTSPLDMERMVTEMFTRVLKNATDSINQ